jgi:oxygen-independent coproporphyrinogen-3 oxidase
MFGLPGQSHEQAIDDVRLAIDSGASHISHYQLTLERNTAFYAQPPKLPADDDAWEMQAEAAQLLQVAGFEQYEISAWSRPDKQCRHNMNYWRFGDFLGIGAGAHAKLTMAGEGRVLRLSKQRHPRQFLSGGRVADESQLAAEDLIFEFFLNTLRLREGIDPELFSRRTGLDWKQVSERLNQAISDGLLEEQKGRIFHTETGWRFINDIQTLFLP